MEDVLPGPSRQRHEWLKSWWKSSLVQTRGVGQGPVEMGLLVFPGDGGSRDPPPLHVVFGVTRSLNVSRK